MPHILITSALPYINGVKHIGNLVGSMLPADVFARFHRLSGDDVLYICATDEHGTPAEIAAAEAGLPVAEYCARQHGVQRDIYQRFDITFDYFGRSSLTANRELTQQFGEWLADNGYIEEKSSLQPYSASDGRFLPDRYVIGTCPYCGFERARGDQCDRCGNLLDPTMLINPRSSISGATDIEFKESNHLYLALDQLEPLVREWVDGQADRWSPLVAGIARKWLTEGLQPRAITRDLDWGVPVGRPGFEGKVYYVWFDAPICYIAATQEWAQSTGNSDAWRKWWARSGGAEYYQFMAKDNVPFHTIMFPAMELGTGQDWKLPDNIYGFEWLTYDGGKFSTSEKRGVFLDDALSLLPADVWRYALARMAPETADSDFSFDELARIVNRDLVGLYGNLVNRVLRQIDRNWGTQLPARAGTEPADTELLDNATATLDEIKACYAEGSMRRAAESVRKLWLLANGYMNATEPWSVVKTDTVRAGTILRLASEVLVASAIVSAPLMPSTSKRILDAFSVAPELSQTWPAQVDELLSDGADFSIPPLLFEKIPGDTVAEWAGAFQGSTTG